MNGSSPTALKPHTAPLDAVTDIPGIPFGGALDILFSSSVSLVHDGPVNSADDHMGVDPPAIMPPPIVIHPVSDDNYNVIPDNDAVSIISRSSDSSTIHGDFELPQPPLPPPGYAFIWTQMPACIWVPTNIPGIFNPHYFTFWVMTLRPEVPVPPAMHGF
ncbi:hypothetical protein HDU93_009105 [Gonapodya sp. JEL0774]|nr:hypothetical protein HDU93_009105 [Gonapodya sp. JEL0774]